MEARGPFRSRAGRAAGGRGERDSCAPSEPGTDPRVTTRDPTHIGKRVAVGYRWGRRREPFHDRSRSPVAEGARRPTFRPPPRGRRASTTTSRFSTTTTTPSSNRATPMSPKSATVDIATAVAAPVGAAGEKRRARAGAPLGLREPDLLDHHRRRARGRRDGRVHFRDAQARARPAPGSRNLVRQEALLTARAVRARGSALPLSSQFVRSLEDRALRSADAPSESRSRQPHVFEQKAESEAQVVVGTLTFSDLRRRSMIDGACGG